MERPNVSGDSFQVLSQPDAEGISVNLGSAKSIDGDFVILVQIDSIPILWDGKIWLRKNVVERRG